MSVIETMERPFEGALDTGVMHIMTEADGDIEVKWNRSNPGEVEIARAAFDSRKKKGLAAYKLRADGSKGELIHEFDPAAERIMLAPPMVGG